MKKILLFMILLGSFTFAEVKTQLDAKVIGENGELLEEGNGKPGDQLRYTFILKNDDESELKNINPTIPIPVGTTFISETATPSNYTVSVDGEKFLKYPIKDKNGKEIPEGSYRAIKWNIPKVEKNGEVSVVVGVKINKPEVSQEPILNVPKIN